VLALTDRQTHSDRQMRAIWRWHLVLDFDHQFSAPNHYRDRRILGRPRLEKQKKGLNTNRNDSYFKAVLFSNDSYLPPPPLLEPPHDSVIVVGTKIKRKSVNDEKECRKTCILHSRPVYAVHSFLHCVASQRLSLTSTSKAPLASMEAVLLLLGTDSIGTGRMASSSSSLSSFESGIEVVER
jgi:hypothetical protein